MKHQERLHALVLLLAAPGLLSCGSSAGGSAAHQQCGNGRIDGAEECDGTAFPAGCSGCDCFGQAGILRCGADCRFDTGGCRDNSECGDGEIDRGEECDGAELGGATCASRGRAEGELACTDACRFDTGGCRGPCTPDCQERECGLDPLCATPCGPDCPEQQSCIDGRCASPPADGIIADHAAVLAFAQGIPAQAIEAARSKLRIFYGHTSHGSQLVHGLGMLGSPWDGFAINESCEADLGHCTDGEP
ncbi:MAG: hypothetical protein FJ125_09860, partial [Deltaproteobacteria bacterium]|nr:hypothetical protein [Deltaproteobacteria bacterium]